MRMLAMMVVLLFSSGVQARVWTTVYRCDETTPLAPVDPNHPHVYAEIVVGTKLAIVISSDTDDFWWGSLEYSRDYETTMSLTARGDAPDYADSCLPAADDDTAVMDPIVGPESLGFEFLNGFRPLPGDWFILDYRAEQVGSCELRLYDLDVAWDVPIEVLSFTHVPSCDFTGDNSVDFEDFALLTLRMSPSWGSAVNDDNSAFDLTADHRVDFYDLIQFSGHWLEQIACDAPQSE
ncbi:MAG TPA: hypothetical protein VLI39_06405 [Sedimentisphaerales bacterium]|nr:hypothetical protein [Sedimentisphaerales bacterium]